MASIDEQSSDARPDARMHFAGRLRALRIPRGFRTARSLARALGIDENRYTRYERAEVEPDLALIRRICEVLAVSPNDLLGPSDADAADGSGARRGSADGLARRDGSAILGDVSAQTDDREVLAWALSGLVAAARLRQSGAWPNSEATEKGIFRSEAMRVYLALEHQPSEALRRIASDPAVQAASPRTIRQIVHLCELIGDTIGGN
jgi:transcriptional regulator with XRE-family HTH domain